MRSGALLLLLAVAVVALFLLSLSIGSVAIPLRDVLSLLGGGAAAKATWSTILFELRLPRALAAALSGAALAVAGLQMQTLFRNPLAGPWALGVTAGAQLGVALVVTAAAAVGSELLARLAWLGELSLTAGAFLGASLVLLAVTAAARQVSAVTLLIVGLMFGYLSQGLVSLVLHFTTETQSRIFSNWLDGSFGGVTPARLGVLVPALLAGLLGAVLLVKPLNALLLGERYARSLGAAVGGVRTAALLGTVVLAGTVTAYCGAIAFLDIAVPHLGRGLLRTSDHRRLVPGVALLGALLALGADLIVHLPWDRHFLHLNAVNALVGAPVVLWVILRQRRGRALEL
ncbi:MAG TPA: iron ABC transporter permease [Acidobacteria bacterium]|nr:iron ABC transporter permease [Acidobacteriota bacterium]